MKDKMIPGKVAKHLKMHYWTHLVVLALLFIAVLFKLVSFVEEPLTANVSLEMFAIIITIVVIPTALKMYAVMLEKLTKDDGFEERVKRYKQASYMRLYSVSAVSLMNIILFAFYRNNNFMWLAILIFVVYIFCKPSYEELHSLILLGEADHKRDEEAKESTAKSNEDEGTSGE
ncbi:MAG: hypothetical protein ACOYEA_02645 [Fermentimonas sp.]|jgi:hypothetical protein